MLDDRPGINVLLIEDDAEDALLTRKLLAREGGRRFNVEVAGTLSSGIAALCANTDAVLLDLSLPDSQGWETFTRLLDAAPHTAIILLTGYDDEELGMKAIHRGAQDYILKSDLTETVLQRGVRHAIERKRIEEELQRVAEALRGRNLQVAEELELARDMQQALLPQRYPCFPAGGDPSQSALSFAHIHRPCRMLGGDFFDVRALSDTVAGVFMCDVMGHGVRSALVAAAMRGLLEEMVSVAPEPDLLLNELNRALRVVTKRPGQLVFASAVSLLIDVAQARVSYAVAGHPSPILVTAGGHCEWLAATGKPAEPALGLFPGRQFTPFHRSLAPGDRLVLFTDGVYEAAGTDGEQYGKERVLRSAETHSALSVHDLVAALVGDADSFAGDTDFEDDVCVVGIGFEHVERETQSQRDMT